MNLQQIVMKTGVSEISDMLLNKEKLKFKQMSIASKAAGFALGGMVIKDMIQTFVPEMPYRQLMVCIVSDLIGYNAAHFVIEKNKFPTMLNNLSIVAADVVDSYTYNTNKIKK